MQWRMGRGVDGKSTLTTDRTVYFLALDQEGKEVFTQNGICPELGNRDRGSIILKLLPRGSTYDLLIAHGHNQNYPGRSKLLLMDSEATRVKSLWNGPLNMKPCGILVGDLNGDGEDEIITYWADSTIRVFDRSLNLLKVKAHMTMPNALVDFAGDKGLEILASRGNRIIIYNGEWKILWESPDLGGPVSPMPTDFEGDGKVDILFCTGKKIGLFRIN